jgi:hypothetical protein
MCFAALPEMQAFRHYRRPLPRLRELDRTARAAAMIARLQAELAEQTAQSDLLLVELEQARTAHQEALEADEALRQTQITPDGRKDAFAASWQHGMANDAADPGRAMPYRAGLARPAVRRVTGR